MGAVDPRDAVAVAEVLPAALGALKAEPWRAFHLVDQSSSDEGRIPLEVGDLLQARFEAALA